jgi:CTP:phosphocholine cytidylyltransferase-like protein
MYPNDIENYIQHNNYYKFKKRSEIVDSRANPDLNEWTYNDSGNKTFVAIYNSNPKSISDVNFYPNNNNNEEHPFEKMAYEMSETIKLF